MEDITKTGPVGLRGLRGIGQTPSASSQYFENLKRMSGSQLSGAFLPEATQDVGQQLIKAGYGESVYDDSITRLSQVDNLSDVRAQEQPWYAQIGAGLAKGVILAGTTFLDGTIGLLVGGAEAVNRGDKSGLWDNDFSRAMQAVNEWSEQVMPNYYSQEELSEPWYKNIFTANFIGDKFIKNLGFSVGALYSGGVTAAGLKVTKLPQLIGAITNSAKAPAAVSTLVGATVSAVNEGRIEALNNSKDWQELKMRELDDSWRDRVYARHDEEIQYLRDEYESAHREYEATKGKLQRVGSGENAMIIDPAYQKYQQRLAAIDAKRQGLEGIIQAEYNNRQSDGDYQAITGKIAEDRLKMGNTDMLLNVPILMASNIVQFTKFYSNGFNTARRAAVSGTMGKYAGETLSKGKAAFRIGKGALAEGTEEISQKAASLVAGDYYSTDVNNFTKSKIDPDAEQETLSWTKSFAKGINDTVNDGSSWEEFFIGSLTGFLGVPGFRSIRNSEGKLQSPIILNGGAFNEFREYQEEVARSQEIADYLNQRVQSPEFLNYYRGMIRHNKYQNDMNQAVEDNDEFDFKNAEHAQFVSDITMFDNAGKLEDLRTYIDMAFDTSDENLQSIVENSTSTDENGNKIGPFVDKNGNPMYATEEGKKQMIDKLTQSRDEMLETLDNYRRTKNDLDIRTGGNLNDDQLSEMTWLKTQVDDWNKRAGQMIPLVKKTLIDISNNLQSNLTQQLADASMEEQEGLIESTGALANLLGIGADRIQQLQKLSQMSDSQLRGILTNPKNERFVEGILQDIDQFGSNIISALDKQNVIRLMSDLPKIGKGIETFNNKLEEYLADPAKVAEEQARAEEQVRQETQERANQSLRDKLNAAQSVAEFRQALNEEQDQSTREAVLEEMKSENNPIAKNYREITQYDTELRQALASLGEDDQTSTDALALWEEHSDNAENLEQIGNLNSVYVNNDQAFIEDSDDVDMADSRFQNARYTLQRAMSKVNNDIKFRDRFSDEYKKPIDEPMRGKGKGTDKDSTGDSGTPTIPPTNPATTPSTTPSIPVGNVTSQMVAEENRKANERVETQRTLDQGQKGQRRYYRPAVPELHIEASKEGDFRPFDVVVGEREQGVDFSGIYGYLRDNRAFDYVNAARLKAGDTLGFMIDPEFNDHTIFIVDTRNNQIVGSIDESDVSIARYEGLDNLVKKVRDEYEASRNQDKAVSTITFTETSEKSGRTRTTTVAVKSDTTDRDGLRKITFKGSFEDSKIGNRELDNASVELSIDDIDLAEYAAGGVTEQGHKITSDEVTEEDKNEAREQIETLLTNASDKVTSPKAKEILISKEGKIFARLQTPSGELTVPLKNSVLEKLNPLLEGSQKSVNPTSTNKFFATPQTRVSKVMVGRIPFISEERSLADTPGVVDGNAKPMFGIIKNGVLVTNGKIDDRLIIKPVDMSQKEGRLYLLIPNAAGTYSPAAVRVKHFNNQEFNLNDATVANTAMGRGINEALDRLADATSQDDISIAMKELAQDIHMQDVMMTWFDAKAGSGIVISKKVRKPDGTYEMVIINGQEQIKEEKTTVYFQSSKKSVNVNGMDIDIEAAKDMGVDMSLFGQPRDAADIRKDILNTLLRYNLPLQVSVSKINEAGYNERLIKSNILTSNLREAKVIGSWFTTDYFDNQGNLQKAISPASVQPAPSRKVQSPVGGTEGVTEGTSVRIDGGEFIVDLSNNTVTDFNGYSYPITFSESTLRAAAMAWAQENFGDATEGSAMTENKVITPQGRVLDRNTGQFLPDAEAQKIKDKIAGRDRETQDRVAKAKRVEAEISENQKKVDKTRTNSDYYYILEEDGQYHPYDRVHKRLGDNWLGDRSKTNSDNALKAGSAVDQVVRDFFIGKTPTRPEVLSEKAFTSLVSRLTEIKSRMEQLGERFLTNNIVLFQKYADGTRVAGEVDILAVDRNGNFKIYDVKTSKYSFEGKNSYFDKKSNRQRMSTKDYYTLQLSAYQNLFESQYGVRPAKLAILPFVLTYDMEGGVVSVEGQKGIPITYNPAVNVPLATTVQAPAETKSDLPILDASVETMNPENRVLPENAFGEGNAKIGFYEKDGKLYSGYLMSIGEIGGMPVHITKVRDKGFGRQGEFGPTSEYIAVFPNGHAMTIIKAAKNDEEAITKITEALKAKPDKVSTLSSQKTQISDGYTKSETAKNNATETSTQTGGAAATIQKEDAVNKKSAKRTRHKLRATDNVRSVFDKGKELTWLEKNLPHLSQSTRKNIISGLIKVAEDGATAWGMYSNGVITLSDIAAEGTVYHEAFHAVFDLGLSESEKEALFNEAREKFGNKPELDLEEDMAEAFREYTASRESNGLGRKILDFFRKLFDKVTNWKYIKPTMNNYFRMINEGRYSKIGTIKGKSSAKYSREEYSDEMKDILSKAPRNSKGRLLAPNGEASNLNERQYAQVRTKAFKDWFGDWENTKSVKKSETINEIVNSDKSWLDDSDVIKRDNKFYYINSYEYRNGVEITEQQYNDFKNNKDIILSSKTIYKDVIFDNYSKVLDENGEPLVVYHRTDDDINIFDVNKSRHGGFWFSRNKNYYKDTKAKRKNAIAVFLNIRKPNMINHEKFENAVDGDVSIEDLRGTDSDGWITYHQHSPEFYGDTYGDKHIVFAMAVSSNQIKSATDNIGTFDKDNPDIRYRRVKPETTWESISSEDKSLLEDKGWTEKIWNRISQAERDNAIECAGL